MTTTTTEPIQQHWTSEVHDHTCDEQGFATAADVGRRLAQLRVDDIDERLVPYLAAAAAEMAFVAGITWRFGTDDPPVALLRLIAKVGMRNPQAGGPHTTRLLEQLAD